MRASKGPKGLARRFARGAVTGALIAIAIASASGLLAFQSAAQAGTTKGFVRINGRPLVLTHAYAATAPDSFDPSVEVRLVLLTPAPLAADAIAKASTRRDLFSLVPAGAVVEVRQGGHTVFLTHAALGDKTLQTGGDPNVKTSDTRVSGSVNTFMPGEEDSFGYKVRFELAFDAPIVKRLPLAKAAAAPAAPVARTPAATAPVAAAPPARATSGPLPKTQADAAKWLSAQRLPTGPTLTDALVSYLTLNPALSVDAVRAYLLAGAAVNRPSEVFGTTALYMAVVQCANQPAIPEIARVLLDAGADPNQKAPDGLKGTPAMSAVFCPDVLRVVLSKKQDLNAVDAKGQTVMHYALQYGKPREAAAQIVKDAGFDIAKWKAALLKDADNADDRKLIEALSGNAPVAAASAPGVASAAAPVTRSGGPPAASRSGASASGASTSALSGRGAIDWKAVGPYPTRSKADATRLLSRPGATTTVDEHLWDAITSREPQRLALALAAGANVRQTRAVTGYTPLVLLAERCELSRDAEAQVSIAEQLIAAGADLTGFDATKANALVVASDDCPVGVVGALLKAGVPAQAPSSNGMTALKAAITAGRVDVVDALLDAGVDPKKEPYNVGRLASGNKAIDAALKKKRKK